MTFEQLSRNSSVRPALRSGRRSRPPRISDAPEEVNCQPDTQLVRCLVNHRKSTEVGISRSNFGVVVGVAAQPP